MTKNIILANRYYDSVVLMNAAEKIKAEIGASQVSLMMGTDANKDIMRATNLLTPDGEKAEPGDLIIAVVANDDSGINKIPDMLEEMLAPKQDGEIEKFTPRSIEGAMDILKGANLALFSIPGEYVDYEGEKALDKGLHLMLFSDNVSLETEIKLKKKGEEKGLLVMGPDCGTSIINGKAIAFANVIRKGDIGIVAAAGTGIQEVATLIHKMGCGITHAIGTGGRDLSREVGGITMRMGIKALMEDPATKILVLISKPPHPDVEKAIYETLEGINKTVIINFLGSDGKEAVARGFGFAPTLEEAAIKAVEASGGHPVLPEPENLDAVMESELSKLASSQKDLRGLYSGGTLCGEADLIFEKAGLSVLSNVTKKAERKLKDVFHSKGHCLVDMGDDIFTKGAPHPMIDNTKRIYRIAQEAEDAETAILLLDVVLGYGSNPDPAGEIAPAVKKAKETASGAGRHLICVASVCGVEEDPQHAPTQIAKLKDAGIIVLPSNAMAARFTMKMLEKIGSKAAV
ncbi:MAG: acyl-CoA synthetase FdrA [Firmicutes bacterium]|nr:acyl-CoA synthetase FdrA [Bacillota bacterium]